MTVGDRKVLLFLGRTHLYEGRGVEPVVTFHHFTTPRWLADQGGWANPQTADRFAAFCERAAGRLVSPFTHVYAAPLWLAIRRRNSSWMTGAPDPAGGW